MPLGTTNFPLDLVDADLFVRFFVVVEPLTVRQVNVVELGVGFGTICQPLALQTMLVDIII